MTLADLFWTGLFCALTYLSLGIIVVVAVGKFVGWVVRS